MTIFTIHNIESAPKKSAEVLKKIDDCMGFVPNVVGEIAESPALLKGYSDLWHASTLGSLSPTERWIIQLTANFMNNCDYGLAADTTIAEEEKVPRPILDALRTDRPLKDPKLEALRTFTKSVLKKMGRAEERDLAAFYKAGYKKEHVMEVVLNLSLKFITSYVNHIASTPLDRAFEENKIESKKSDKKSRNVA